MGHNRAGVRLRTKIKRRIKNEATRLKKQAAAKPAEAAKA